MTRISQEGRFKVVQDGDKFGSIIRSKNLSLAKDGTVALNKNSIVLYSEEDDAGFGNPLAMETDGTIAYVLTVGHLFRFRLNQLFLDPDEANATNQPATDEDSDMVLFNGTIVASGGDEVNYLSALGVGQGWNGTPPINDLDATMPHPLCVNNRAVTLLVGDGNVLRQYSTSYVRDTSNELTIPQEYIITVVRQRGTYIYVGTRHRYGGEAKVFLWNGSGLRNQAEYGVGCDWVYSMTELKSSIALVVSSGQILRFNGGGFDMLAAFPVYYTPYSWNSLADDDSLIGKVASRGMRADGDKLYINIDGSLNTTALVEPGTYIPEQPSGIWCLDPSAGLYHVAGYNYKTMLNLDISEVASNYLVFAEAHQAQTGDAFLMVGGNITGLTSQQVYYAIVDSPNTVKVATSKQNALNGEYLIISGTPDTDRCYFNRYESMGQTSITQPGGMLVFGRTNPNAFYGSEILFGGATINEAQASKGVIMSLGLGRNQGYFVTAKIPTSEITNTYQKIVAMFEHLDLPTDFLTLKWRKVKKTSLPTPLFFSGAANWTSTTTFTVDTLLKPFGGVSVGDEIEIVEGAAGGYIAHITGINTDSTTYTVTIDEEMPVSSGQFDFVVDNWQKLGSDINNETSPTAKDAGFSTKEVNTTATWIEIKVVMGGRGVMIEEMQSVNSPNGK